MAPKTTTVRKDIIPYEAGVVILTPLDANKKPDYTRSVATQRDFLTSTQTSVTRTVETLANGNGSDKDFITDEVYNLTVVGNTYNPQFHAAVAGRIESEPATELMPYEFSANVPGAAEYEIQLGTGGVVELEPAADADGKYNFIVEDSYGNVMAATKTAPEDAQHYQYDSATKALIFNEEAANMNVRVIMWVATDGGYKIESNPILTQPEYQIECFGISMSAGSDEKYRVVTKLLRATTTGDLSEQATQKSKSAPITYNFKSTPVPAGVSVYSQYMVPYEITAGA